MRTISTPKFSVSEAENKLSNALKSQAVTWSANGKSASGTMYIYQEANKEYVQKYEDTSGNVFTVSPSTLDYTGGSVSVTMNIKVYTTYSYTSGSTRTATNTQAGSVTSNASWLPAPSGQGWSGTKTVTVGTNSGSSSRTGTLTAKGTLTGRTMTAIVTQEYQKPVATTNTLTIYFDKPGGINSWHVDTYTNVMGNGLNATYTLNRLSTDGPITIGVSMSYGSYATQMLGAYYSGGPVDVSMSSSMGGSSANYLELNEPQDINATIYWVPTSSSEVFFDCS